MVAKLTWDRGTPKKFKLPDRPTHGMNIRPCEKIAKQLFCEMWQNRGHTHLIHAVLEDEIVYDHHSRTDAPRCLTKAVMAVWDYAKEWLDRIDAAAATGAVVKPRTKPAARTRTPAKKATPAKAPATAGKKGGKK